MVQKKGGTQLDRNADQTLDQTPIPKEDARGGGSVMIKVRSKAINQSIIMCNARREQGVVASDGGGFRVERRVRTNTRPWSAPKIDNRNRRSLEEKATWSQKERIRKKRNDANVSDVREARSTIKWSPTSVHMEVV